MMSPPLVRDGHILHLHRAYLTVKTVQFQNTIVSLLIGVIAVLTL